MISDVGPQDLLSRVPCRCYPPLTARRGSGCCNLLLPVYRCSMQPACIAMETGSHRLYVLVCGDVSHADGKLEEVKGRESRRSILFIFASTRFVSSLTAVYVRRLGTRSRTFLAQLFLKVLLKLTKSKNNVL